MDLAAVRLEAARAVVVERGDRITTSTRSGTTST
jgi:hypothetical protein